MRIDQFNDLSITNIIGAETRGAEDEFNSHLKRERHADPPEFSSQEVEEYINCSETLDMMTQQSDDRRDRHSEEQNFGGNRFDSRAMQSLTKSLVQQAVCMAAGAVIVTNSYQTMVEARNAERTNLPDPPAAVVEIVEPAGTKTEETQNVESRNDTPIENSDFESADGNSSDSGGGSSGGDSSGDSDGSSAEYTGETSDDTDDDPIETDDDTDDDPIETDDETDDETGVETGDSTGGESDAENGDGTGGETDAEKGDGTGGETDAETGDGTGGETGGGSGDGGGGSTGGDSGDSGGQPPIVLPKGHTFGEPTRKNLGNGKIELTYQCADHENETYVITISVSPEQ